MKIQLDTTQKIIKVEEAVNLGEFLELLEKLLPKNKWKEFKLETQTIINWSNPITIQPYVPYVPNPRWERPWITYISGTSGLTVEQQNYSLNSGVYNVEI